MSDTRYFVGCDPDLSTMPVVVIGQDFAIVRIQVIRNVRSGALGMIRCLSEMGKWYGDITAAAVEGQMIYPKVAGRKLPPPNDILHLGQVAGAMLAFLTPVSEAVYFPTPAEWKGQIEKLPHHRRILTKSHISQDTWFEAGGRERYLGIRKEFTPSWDVTAGEWKHITDGLGLAQYAAERWKAEALKQKLLQEKRSEQPLSDHFPGRSPSIFPGAAVHAQ